MIQHLEIKMESQINSLETRIKKMQERFNKDLEEIEGFPGGSEVKASASNTGDLGSIPGLGRSPNRGQGNPLQYFCLENLMGRGACKATVHRDAKSHHKECSNKIFRGYLEKILKLNRGKCRKFLHCFE